MTLHAEFPIMDLFVPFLALFSRHFLQIAVANAIVKCVIIVEMHLIDQSSIQLVFSYASLLDIAIWWKWPISLASTESITLYCKSQN